MASTTDDTLMQISQTLQKMEKHHQYISGFEERMLQRQKLDQDEIDELSKRVFERPR